MLIGARHYLVIILPILRNRLVISAVVGKKCFTVYILLNIVGYVMWRRDERLREELERV